jgi:hypothetical protein
LSSFDGVLLVDADSVFGASVEGLAASVDPLLTLKNDGIQHSIGAKYKSVCFVPARRRLSVDREHTVDCAEGIELIYFVATNRSAGKGFHWSIHAREVEGSTKKSSY